MTQLQARALIGPNLYCAEPAAVAELESESISPEFVAAIHREYRALRVALGWPAITLLERAYRCQNGDQGLALAAPTCEENCEADAILLERAIRRALSKEPPALDSDLEAITAKQRSERRSPALRALIHAAQSRGVMTLVDDDALSLGAGLRSRTWPIDQIPAESEVPWQKLGEIPIALISGTNGKTTCARLLARLATGAGHCVGTTSTDGVVVGGVMIESGDWTGPGATRMVLRHPDVDFAALEIARGGLLRRGLVIHRADAALITNISADHLGDYGITDLQAMAAVKVVLGSVVKQSGRVILGADSAPLRGVDTSRFRAPIVWFAMSPQNPTLQAHLSAGGEVWYVADGSLCFAARGREEPLLEVASIPCTIGGAATHNVQNALAVAALARAIGLPRAAIIDGLRSFRSSAEENPGRVNRFELNGLMIVLDFAHNPAGIGALGEVLQALRGTGRLTVAFGMAGDRNEADLRLLAGALADLKPDRVLLREQEEHLRGRKLGEVPALLRRGLLDHGMNPARISEVRDELATIHRVLADAQPGDTLAILAHTQ
ncbi:MAG TPA: hypothetical protein ENJ18_04500, partial [Nannocystis exedens]|nr:hypothetical protein [Nannocystis exedens]